MSLVKRAQNTDIDSLFLEYKCTFLLENGQPQLSSAERLSDAVRSLDHLRHYSRGAVVDHLLYVVNGQFVAEVEYAR